MYMRSNISAQSAASTPPAPDRMVIRASRSSYSPERSVRISSSPTTASSAFSSFSASSSDSWSPASSANSKRTGRSESLLCTDSNLRNSPWTVDSFEVTFCAFAWSSHKLGTDASASSAAMDSFIRGTSSTVPILLTLTASSFSRS